MLPQKPVVEPSKRNIARRIEQILFFWVVFEPPFWCTFDDAAGMELRLKLSGFSKPNLLVSCPKALWWEGGCSRCYSDVAKQVAGDIGIQLTP